MTLYPSYFVLSVKITLPALDLVDLPVLRLLGQSEVALPVVAVSK